MAHKPGLRPALATEEQMVAWRPAARVFAREYAALKFADGEKPYLAIDYARRMGLKARTFYAWRAAKRNAHGVLVDEQDRGQVFSAHIRQLELDNGAHRAYWVKKHGQLQRGRNEQIAGQEAADVAAEAAGELIIRQRPQDIFLRVLEAKLSHTIACKRAKLNWEGVQELLDTDQKFLASYEKILGPRDPDMTWVGARAQDVLYRKAVIDENHQSALAVVKALVDKFKARSLQVKKPPPAAGSSQGFSKTTKAAKAAHAMYADLMTPAPPEPHEVN